MNKKLLIKLEKKRKNNIKVQPIFQNDKNRFLLDGFLRKQMFLNTNDVLAILKISFLKDQPIGYALIKDEKKIIGFLGTIFSTRTLGDIKVEHCYLHSWIVFEENRIDAFKLIIPIIKKNIFISTYSPIKSLEGLYKKLQFEENQFFSEFRLPSFVLSFRKTSISLNENTSLFIEYLQNKDKIFLSDHESTRTKKILIYFNKNMRDNIFVMAKKSIKKGIFPLLEIIYISDYNKFELHEKKINFELIKRFKTVFLKYNYSEGNGISSKNFLFRKITKKKIFYLNKPKNFKFDVLYSELLS